MVEFLLQSGAKINAKDTNGMTPLILASSKGYHSIVKLLLDWHARMHSKDNRGFTALDYARHNADKEMIKLLSYKAR